MESWLLPILCTSLGIPAGCWTGRMNRRSGLTLVETLIVVGIVLLLSAVAYPILSRSVLSAKESHGIHKMRQIHLAHMLYQADNGGGGTYGLPSSMGLPPRPYTYDWSSNTYWYAAASYGMNHDLHKAPCAPNPQFGDKYDTFALVMVDFDQIVPRVQAFKENMIMVVHEQCSPWNDSYQYKLKRSSAVLLSGKAVVRTGYGNMLLPQSYGDPLE